jgi:hypothetical protein
LNWSETNIVKYQIISGYRWNQPDLEWRGSARPRIFPKTKKNTLAFFKERFIIPNGKAEYSTRSPKERTSGQWWVGSKWKNGHTLPG